MSQYEWDENKNQSNQKKHGISFEDAKNVFDDEDAVAYPGQIRAGENRFCWWVKYLVSLLLQ